MIDEDDLHANRYAAAAADVSSASAATGARDRTAGVTSATSRRATASSGATSAIAYLVEFMVIGASLWGAWLFAGVYSDGD